MPHTVVTTVRFNDQWVEVRLHFGVRWCQRLHIVGAVWKHTIFLANERHHVPAWVLAHELIHIWQWRTGGGWWRHLGRYLRSLWEWGYLPSPYEREAVTHQRAVATGTRCLLPYRSAADYRRNDDRSTVSGTQFTGIHAPFLAEWDTTIWAIPGGALWQGGKPFTPFRPSVVLPHLESDDSDFDPGTYLPDNNDHEQDGA